MIDELDVELRARIYLGQPPGSSSLEFILPLLARRRERVEQVSPDKVRYDHAEGQGTL